MANKKTNEEDGVWRTIGGRRVFIRNGQSLADAMKESGKFKNLKDIEHQQRKINNELAGLTGKDKEQADEEFDAYEELKKKEEKDKNEEYTFEEIKDDFESAEEYEDLYNACSKIKDEKLRKQIEKDIGVAEDHDENVDNVASEITSDYIDKLAMEGEKNVAKNDITDEDVKKMVERDKKNFDKGQAEMDANTREFFEKENKMWDYMIKNQFSDADLKEAYANKDHYNEAKQKSLEEEYKKRFGEEPQFTQKQIDAMDKLANQAKEGARSDIKDFLSGKENYDGTRDEFIKDVADEWGLDKNEVEDMLHDENAKHPRNFKNVSSKEQQKQMTENFKSAKDKAFKDMKDAENAWLESYNNADWNNENWRVQDKELSQKRDETREAYNKAMKNYLDNANEEDLSWLDKVARNDIRQEEELKKYSNFRNDEERDKYYEVFRKYERENAKLKAEGAKPEDEYVPLNSWGSFHNKMEELMKDNENAKWTGKEYTNDEFMEHLEDANWHTERRMLETAGLTNQEMEYIKDHTTLAAWSADLDRDKTQKLINEAKDKFRFNKDNSQEYTKSQAEAMGITNADIQLSKQLRGESKTSPFESKRVAENEIREKGYQYFSTHGVGPGTHPNDVKSRELDVDLPGGWTTFKTDRPLTQQELDYYDIQPETRNSEFRKRFGLNEDNTKKTTNQTMNNAIRQSVSKKSTSKSTSQRYSGTLAYLKEMGLTQHTINEIIKRMEEDNKK